MSENRPRQPAASYKGRTVVLAVYAVVVAVAGVTGYLLGSFRTGLRPVELFFLVELPPTPLGLAVYGMVTLAVGLGLALVAVRYVSREYAA